MMNVDQLMPRCRTRRRPAFLAISTDSRNFNSPRKLEMRRSRFSGTTDSAEASLQIARPIRGGFQQRARIAQLLGRCGRSGPISLQFVSSANQKEVRSAKSSAP